MLPRRSSWRPPRRSSPRPNPAAMGGGRRWRGAGPPAVAKAANRRDPKAAERLLRAEEGLIAGWVAQQSPPPAPSIAAEQTDPTAPSAGLEPIAAAEQALQEGESVRAAKSATSSSIIAVYLADACLQFTTTIALWIAGSCMVLALNAKSTRPIHAATVL